VFPGAVVYEYPNYGYPFVGAARRRGTPIIGVTHITGNYQLPSALAEVKYASRAGSGASFHFCVNRNGTVVQAIDPFLFAAWTNGDINKPDTTNPYVADMVGSPYNPNEFNLVAIENVGFENADGSPAPLTDAQVEANAQIYAWAAAKLGRSSIHIDRVVGHRMINSVTRWHCPAYRDLLALRKRIQQRANEILGAAPAPEEDPAVIADLEAQLREAKAKLKARWAWIVKLRAKVDALEGSLAEAQAALDAASDDAAELAEALRTVRRLRNRVNEVKQIIADAEAEAQAV
jgi:hypothetical protein